MRGGPPYSGMRFSAISSSTTLLVCQKNRYGEIVVPRMATKADCTPACVVRSTPASSSVASAIATMMMNASCR